MGNSGDQKAAPYLDIFSCDCMHRKVGIKNNVVLHFVYYEYKECLYNIYMHFIEHYTR